MTFRSHALVPTMVFALMALVPTSAFAQGPGPDGVIPGEWIVTLADTANPNAEAFGLTQAFGGQVRHVYAAALNGFSFSGPEAVATAMARSPLVASVVPNRAVRVITEVVPEGMQRVRAAHDSDLNAHGQGYTGLGARVAVLDTGISIHDDLNNLYGGLGLSCMTTPPSQNPADFVDGHGHGTHVSGTVAALDNDFGVIGVAPSADLVPVKVLDDAGDGTWDTVICGIDYVTSLVVDSGVDITVANLSLAGPGSSTGSCSDALDNDPLHKALCGAVDAGVTVVVGAGNSAIDASGEVPAAYGTDAGIVTVSASVHFDGEPGVSSCAVYIGLGRICDEDLAPFSNFGSPIDVVAPGMEVYSTEPNDAYGHRSGTSMAAPHVAGVVALIGSSTPSPLTPAQVETLLKANSQCPNGTQSAGSGGCTDQGQWRKDPDGTTEPLIHALWAAEAAAGGVVNAAPTISITAPTDGSSFDEGVSIGFAGTATDDEDGDLTSSLAWDSSLDGPIGSGGSFSSTSLSVGTHVITASTTDSGNLTGQASITVTVTAAGGNTAPTVSIIAPLNGSSSDEGASIGFAGTATDDEDGDLTSSLAWDSNLDGPIGAGGSFSSASLSVGTHTITASATDSGALTGQASVTVTVHAVGGFTLSATGYKVRGMQKADLQWSGATSNPVNILRSGVVVATTADDGAYTDNIDNRGGGSYTYQVCNTGTTPTCSNAVTVSF